MKRSLLMLIIVLVLTDGLPAQDADHLSGAEIQAALQLSPKKHHAELIDMQTVFAHTGSGQGKQLPKIEVFMPDAWIAFQREYAKKQYLKYEPTNEDTLRAMTIVASGMAIGTSSGPACDSVARIALISDKAGSVVVESLKNESQDSTWQNAFGAKATCVSVKAKFMLSEISRVQAAADKGQFTIAVFYAGGSSKMYKVKSYYLKDLGL